MGGRGPRRAQWNRDEREPGTSPTFHHSRASRRAERGVRQSAQGDSPSAAMRIAHTQGGSKELTADTALVALDLRMSVTLFGFGRLAT